MWATYVLAAWGAASVFVAWVAVARAVVARYEQHQHAIAEIIPPPM